MFPRLLLLALLAGLLPVLMAFADRPPADEARAPVEVRIVAAERTTISKAPFVSLSCELHNPNASDVRFVGYESDSYDPPLKEGTCSPIYLVQLQRDGKWQYHQLGWCGTGIGKIRLTVDGTATFAVAVPYDAGWEAVRVGVRWTGRPQASLDFELPWDTAWSEPFSLAD